jgi:hypothetical protein
VSSWRLQQEKQERGRFLKKRRKTFLTLGLRRTSGTGLIRKKFSYGLLAGWLKQERGRFLEKAAQKLF